MKRCIVSPSMGISWVKVLPQSAMLPLLSMSEQGERDILINLGNYTAGIRLFVISKTPQMSFFSN